MAECWASPLGPCSKKHSREHLVSRSLFVDPLIRVKGFAWCKDQEKTIKPGSLVAKILCTQHNEDLSSVDAAGCSAFAVFREVRRVANVREAMRVQPAVWNVIRYSIGGKLLERWFLKTLINLALNSEYPIGQGSLPGKPTEELVRTAFGLLPFKNRAGLYSIVHAGQLINSTDTLVFSPLIKDKTYIIGGLFSFRGFRFLLALMPEGAPSPLSNVWLDGEDVGLSQLNYHNRLITENQVTHRSQVVEVKWGEPLSG